MKRMLEMTYKMPDPKFGVSRPYIGISESRNAYTASQMQQAYAAGRESMRQECYNAHTDHPMRHYDRTCPACLQKTSAWKTECRST